MCRFSPTKEEGLWKHNQFGLRKCKIDLLSANFSTTLCPTLLHYSTFWMDFDPYTHLKFPNFFPLLLLFPLQRILSSFPPFSLTTFPTCFCMFKLYHPLKVHFPPFYYENVQSRNNLYSEKPHTHLLDRSQRDSWKGRRQPELTLGTQTLAASI